MFVSLNFLSVPPHQFQAKSVGNVTSFTNPQLSQLSPLNSKKRRSPQNIPKKAASKGWIYLDAGYGKVMGEWSWSTELPALAVAWWKWITHWKLTFRIIPISPKSLSGFQAGFSWNVWCHGMWLNLTWLVNFGGRIGCRGQCEKKESWIM